MSEQHAQRCRLARVCNNCDALRLSACGGCAQEIRNFLIVTQQLGLPLPLSVVYGAISRLREVVPKLTIWHSTMLFKGLKYYAGVPGITDMLRQLTTQARSACLRCAHCVASSRATVVVSVSAHLGTAGGSTCSLPAHMLVAP